jgi:hypothetical protein
MLVAGGFNPVLTPGAIGEKIRHGAMSAILKKKRVPGKSRSATGRH